jgi:large subunit ribosomal protein L15
MRLNTLKPGAGSKKTAKRLGRGGGSGLGKTSGKGHKGQHARAGGYHKVGFEGGQMPLQRRLPKRGFRSKLAVLTAEVRLHELNGLDAAVIDLAVLKAAQIVPATAEKAKVFMSGKLDKAVTLKGVMVTKGAQAAITAAGGKVEA